MQKFIKLLDACDLQNFDLVFLSWNLRVFILHVFLQIPGVFSAITTNQTVMKVYTRIDKMSLRTRWRAGRGPITTAFAYVVYKASFVCVTSSTPIANVWFGGKFVAARTIPPCL